MIEKIKKIKMQLSKLNLAELNEISTYVYDRKKIVSKREFDVLIQKKIDDITALPVGTKVIINNHNWPDFTGKIGTIVRHKERKSIMTIVKIDELPWSIPRKYLSADLSEKNLEMIQKRKKDGQVITKIFDKIGF